MDSGQHTLDILKSNTYDLILMDINMPEMDGIETLSQIRNQNIKTPVVALTAEAGTNVETELTQKGFDGYISKPFDANALLIFLVEQLT